MGRWEPDAEGRLRQAALELYADRGFEPTTVAEIAERAGVTERTFFRHFADKREVLFVDSHFLEDPLAAGIAAAPDGRPLDLVVAGLIGLVDRFEHERGRVRAGVIAANPGLRERELLKLASLAGAAAAALRDRGVAEPAATLAAESGLALFRSAFGAWITGPADGDLAACLRVALGQLRDAVGG